MEQGMQTGVMNEKYILTLTKNQFLVRLFETYNSEQSLYFLMEAALGGELYALYFRKGFHGSVPHAQYVAGSAATAVHLPGADSAGCSRDRLRVIGKLLAGGAVGTRSPSIALLAPQYYSKYLCDTNHTATHFRFVGHFPRS